MTCLYKNNGAVSCVGGNIWFIWSLYRPIGSHLHTCVPQGVSGNWIPKWMGSFHGQILIETATHSFGTEKLFYKIMWKPTAYSMKQLIDIVLAIFDKFEVIWLYPSVNVWKCYIKYEFFPFWLTNKLLWMSDLQIIHIIKALYGIKKGHKLMIIFNFKLLIYIYNTWYIW